MKLTAFAVVTEDHITNQNTIWDISNDGFFLEKRLYELKGRFPERFFDLVPVTITWTKPKKVKK